MTVQFIVMQQGGHKRVFTRYFVEDILREDGHDNVEDEKREDLPLDLSIGEKKKMRTTFTGWQIFELEKIFEEKKYINCAERKHLSRYLHGIASRGSTSLTQLTNIEGLLFYEYFNGKYTRFKEVKINNY